MQIFFIFSSLLTCFALRKRFDFYDNTYDRKQLLDYDDLITYYQVRPYTIIDKFENELPTAIIHGVSDICETAKLWMIIDAAKHMSQFYGKEIKVECVEFGGSWAKEESILYSM